MLYKIVKFLLLSELVDVKSQLRFQIASFVFVNDVHFSQLIQHLCNAWVHCNCFCFISSCTKLSNSISHGFAIISVVKSSCLILFSDDL